MVKYSPYRDFNLSLHELEACKMHMNLFDAMFSGQKFLMFEQRDQYIANSDIQTGVVPKGHCESGVWKCFW